jgi:ribosomal protein S18 acetylase RimI-like enzyme
MLCNHLLQTAASQGARIGYLQVDAANKPARKVYHRLGFIDGYAYHYRAADPTLA